MSRKATEERKQIERRLEKLSAEIDAALEESKAANRRCSELMKVRDELRARLEELKPKAVTVSDHAVLRYLERKAGVDVQAIKDMILQDERLRQQLETLGGSGKFPVNGFQVVMRDYTVVTIN